MMQFCIVSHGASYRRETINHTQTPRSIRQMLFLGVLLIVIGASLFRVC